MTVRTRRLAAFGLFAALLQAGPVADQLFHRSHWWLQGWQMYSAKGADVFDVRYEVTAVDGTVRRALVREIAGLPPRARIAGVDAARDYGTRWCRKQPAGTELRVSVRAGHWRKGWVVEAEREELCKR